jgi:hypothetical protein
LAQFRRVAASVTIAQDQTNDKHLGSAIPSPVKLESCLPKDPALSF